MSRLYKRCKVFSLKRGVKHCPRCDKVRLLTRFRRDSRSKSGYQTYCNICLDKLHRQYRMLNPERCRQIQRDSRNRHAAANVYRWLRHRSANSKITICSLDEFKNWYDHVEKACEYCGITESHSLQLFRHKLHIDRKVGDLGYVISNIVMACQRCNLIKNGYLTYQDMKEIANVYIKPRLPKEM